MRVGWREGQACLTLMSELDWFVEDETEEEERGWLHEILLQESSYLLARRMWIADWLRLIKITECATADLISDALPLHSCGRVLAKHVYKTRPRGLSGAYND